MKDIRSYLTNYDTATTAFSKGKLKDNPGDDTGSGITVKTHNDLYYAVIAVIERWLTGGIRGTDESEAAGTADLADAIEEYVSGLDDANVKLTGAQTVTGDKNFGGALEKDGNPVVTTSSGTQTIAGTKTFSGSVDFSGTVRPKTDPVTGEVSVAIDSRYTPIRGLYNADWSNTTGYRGGKATLRDSVFDGISGSQGGPYTGDPTTRISNDEFSATSITWWYARF